MSQRHWKIIACLFLVLATATVYAELRNHQFINLDDNFYVTYNSQVQRGLTLGGLAWAFTYTNPYWIPLTWLSHMLDCQLFGMAPGPHHLTNLFFHIVNSLLLFLWLLRLTRAAGRSFLVAALFALHPLHVESVAWVAERKDVLSTFFWLLTMWAYVWYVERPGFRRYLLVLLSFGLGLMAKPMLVTLPLVLLLLDYWPLARWAPRAAEAAGDPETSGPGVSLKHLVREKVPLFALAVLCSLITLYGQQVSNAVVPLARFPLTMRLADACVAYLSYLAKMIWPSRLAILYPLSLNRPPLWQPLGAALVLAALSFLAIRLGRRHPYLPVGWFWYLGALAPVIGVVQVGLQASADRFTYVPLIGLFLIVAWGSAEVAAGWRPGRFLLPAGAGLILAALALCTWAQVRHWRDSVSLFEHTLRVTGDNPTAQYSLGLALEQQGRLAQAVAHYEEALRLNREAVSPNPDYATLHNDLGLALFQQGKLAQALAHYQTALALNPNYAPAYNNLGNALIVQGKLDQAIACYQRALQLDPHNGLAHYNLGLALMSQHQVGTALWHFRDAVRLEPNRPIYLNKLARLLATAADPQLRNGPAAVPLAEMANQLSGDGQPEMLDTLAAAYAEAGRFPEAVRASRKAVDLASSRGQPELAKQMESRMRLYQAGQPYHESAGS